MELHNLAANRTLIVRVVLNGLPLRVSVRGATDFAADPQPAGQFSANVVWENPNNDLFFLQLDYVPHVDDGDFTLRFLDPGGVQLGATTISPASRVSFPYFNWVGTDRWPGDGQPATPGGSPGTDGLGGTFTAFTRTSVPPGWVSSTGGLAGERASDQSGGPGGTPSYALWWDHSCVFGCEAARRMSVAGAPWTAPPRAIASQCA